MKKKHHSSMSKMHEKMGVLHHGKSSAKGGVEMIGPATMKKMTHHLGKASMHHEKAMHHTQKAHELSGAMPSPEGRSGGKLLKSRMYG